VGIVGSDCLARASGVTKTIKLGTGITLVPERNPLLLAKEIASLDLFSGGRFLFGIGTGWLREETELMGGDFEHRWTQTREAIEVMKALWTHDEAEYHGRYFNFPLVRSYPKPAQKPHPPVWIAAISTEESFLYAARNGFNLMIVPYAGKPGQLQEFVRTYRRVWAESGHKPGAEQVQVAQFGYVAENRAEAQAGFERICRKYLQTFADAVVSWQGKTSDQYPGYEKMVASILATTPEKIVQQGGAFVGTPEDVVGQIRACSGAFGASTEGASGDGAAPSAGGATGFTGVGFS